jgi:hypothetical protein
MLDRGLLEDMLLLLVFDPVTVSEPFCDPLERDQLVVILPMMIRYLKLLPLKVHNVDIFLVRHNESIPPSHKYGRDNSPPVASFR